MDAIAVSPNKRDAGGASVQTSDIESKLSFACSTFKAEGLARSSAAGERPIMFIATSLKL